MYALQMPIHGRWITVAVGFWEDMLDDLRFWAGVYVMRLRRYRGELVFIDYDPRSEGREDVL